MFVVKLMRYALTSVTQWHNAILLESLSDTYLATESYNINKANKNTTIGIYNVNIPLHN